MGGLIALPRSFVRQSSGRKVSREVALTFKRLDEKAKNRSYRETYKV